MKTFQQKEIWYADLNPSKGSEQAGYRPVLIISGNLMNTYLNTVICCPLTSKVKNYKGNVLLVPSPQNGLKDHSEVLVFHVRSIAKERLIEKIGSVEQTQLDAALEGLHDILTL